MTAEHFTFREIEPQVKQVGCAADVSHFKDRVRGRTLRFMKKYNILRLPCVCGEGKTQVHHHDYERALDVAFLCAPCHVAEHSNRLKVPFEIHDLRWLAVADVVAFA